MLSGCKRSASTSGKFSLIRHWNVKWKQLLWNITIQVVGSTEAKQLLYVASLDCYKFPLTKVEGLRKTRVNLELVGTYCSINHILEKKKKKKKRRFFVVCRTLVWIQNWMELNDL